MQKITFYTPEGNRVTLPVDAEKGVTIAALEPDTQLAITLQDTQATEVYYFDGSRKKR